MIIQNINFFNGRIHIQIRMISIRIRKKSWEKKHQIPDQDHLLKIRNFESGDSYPCLFINLNSE